MTSTVCLTFEFDALSVWLAYDEPTAAMLWRGEYGARVGVLRVLAFLERERLPATFFVPGHTIESFPSETGTILAAGHAVAHHSWAHVDPSGQSEAEERADPETVCRHPQVIGRGHRIAMLERFVGHCRDAGATFERLVDVARRLPEPS